jgi:hypothetical protein
LLPNGIIIDQTLTPVLGFLQVREFGEFPDGFGRFGHGADLSTRKLTLKALDPIRRGDEMMRKEI